MEIDDKVVDIIKQMFADPDFGNDAEEDSTGPVYCIYCYRETPYGQPMKHKMGCPVLVVRESL